MTHYSVLIPHRDATAAVVEQALQVRDVLERLALPYEILCIDDGSTEPTNPLDELAATPNIRRIRLDRPRGLSEALGEGIAAARGEIVIAIEPGRQYRPDQIPLLVSCLSRGDLAFGRRPRSRWGKFAARIKRIPRWLTVGLEVRDPDCLFWAARREAIAGILLRRGMSRYLAVLAAAQGFRVVETPVDVAGPAAAMADAWPNPLDLARAWRLGRQLRRQAAATARSTTLIFEAHARAAESSRTRRAADSPSWNNRQGRRDSA